MRALLIDAGATEEEIEQAVAGGVLDLLAVDRLLVPSARRYTAAEVTEATGLPIDLMKRFWRALGFLDVADDDPAFTDLDIQAVQLFQGMLRLGATDVGSALQLARVIGSSMARIADAEVVPGSMALAAGDEDDVLAADAFASVAGATIPAMSWLLEFVWRRHVQAATRRTMLLRADGNVSAAGPVLAVGFADMVGFTLLSQHLDQGELAAVVRTVRGDLPRHRDRARRAGRQDDRRRGDVRRSRAWSGPPASGSAWPRHTPTTSCCRTSGSGWRSVRCWSTTAITTGRRSTWPIGSSTSPTRGRC